MNALADLTLCWAHMSEVTFSDIEAYIMFIKVGIILLEIVLSCLKTILILRTEGQIGFNP